MDLTTRLEKRLHFSSEDTEEVYRLIAKTDAIKGQWKLSDKLSPQLITSLQKSVLITSTGASTRIEGSKLTDEEVRELLSKFRIKKFKTRDEQEVAGYLELLQQVFDAWDSVPFNENTILGFHSQLMKYSEKDSSHKGNYKPSSNRVEARDNSGNLLGIIFDPTPPHLVSKEMHELVTWTQKALNKKTKHPLLIIANFCFEFLAIHPFLDGNGRLSRILTNFLLLKSGYIYVPFVSHEKFIEDSKAEYYLALNSVQKTWKTEHENISPWILFFLKTVLSQSEQALNILTQESIEVYLSEKQTQVWQFALSKDIFSRSDTIEATGLNHRTIEQSIKKLVTMNALERLGEGKGTRYRVAKKGRL